MIFGAIYNFLCILQVSAELCVEPKFNFVFSGISELKIAQNPFCTPGWLAIVADSGPDEFDHGSKLTRTQAGHGRRRWSGSLAANDATPVVGEDSSAISGGAQTRLGYTSTPTTSTHACGFNGATSF